MLYTVQYVISARKYIFIYLFILFDITVPCVQCTFKKFNVNNYFKLLPKSYGSSSIQELYISQSLTLFCCWIILTSKRLYGS